MNGVPYNSFLYSPNITGLKKTSLNPQTNILRNLMTFEGDLCRGHAKFFLGGINQITTVSCWWFFTKPFEKIRASQNGWKSSPTRWNHHLSFNGCFNWIICKSLHGKWLFGVPGFGYCSSQSSWSFNKRRGIAGHACHSDPTDKFVLAGDLPFSPFPSVSIPREHC